jgi:tetratricopeptide (TPR) repeat protein
MMPKLTRRRKSQLAIEYARDLRQQSPETWVLWIHASNAARFDQSVHEISDRLRLPGHEDPKANHLKFLQRWLENENNGSWLIVLDNADDASFLLEPPPMASEAQHDRQRMEYFPVSDHGSMIITTRSKDQALRLVFEDDIVPITPMSEGEASLLMTSKLGRWEDEISDLVSALDLMPLAISQAASYIRARGSRWSVQKYREEMEESRKSRTSLLRYEMPLPNRDKYATNSVFLTWQISFEYVNENHRSAADLLSFMSFCDRLAIPEALICDEDEDGRPRNAASLEEDIIKLRGFSLINETLNGQAWEMHRLVQDATQAWLEDCGRIDSAHDRFVHRLNAIIPDGEFESWPLCRILHPHARQAFTQKPRESSAIIRWARVMYRAASYALEQGDFATCQAMAEASMTTRRLHLGEEDQWTMAAVAMVAEAKKQQGRWSEAEQLQLPVLLASKRLLGPDHDQTLVIASSLGGTYANQGKWDMAEQLEKEVLEKRENLAGAEAPETLRAMNNLSITYWNQGRWNEAEKLQATTLKAREALYGPGHPLTVLSMSNLAATYQSQRRWADAEPLELSVVEKRTAVLGPKHPLTLMSMSNLAVTLSQIGRVHEAVQLSKKVLETKIETLGPEHPDTLISQGNLAATYSNEGGLDEAETLLVQVFETRERVLGAEHPHTLDSASKLGKHYFDRERWAEAQQLQEHVMHVRKAAFGMCHPATLEVMFHLAVTYSKLERWSEAEQLDQHVLQERNEALGEGHPDTVLSMNNLAFDLFSQERFDEAEPLFVRALELSTASHGADRPETLDIMDNLTTLYRKQGRLVEAEQFGIRVVNARRTILGEEHPDTLVSMAILGATYWHQGQWSKSEALDARVLGKRKALFGADHPKTLTSMVSLAWTYARQERWTEALLLHAEAADGLTKLYGHDHPDTVLAVSNFRAALQRVQQQGTVGGTDMVVIEGDEVPGHDTNTTIDETAEQTNIPTSPGERCQSTSLQSPISPEGCDADPQSIKAGDLQDITAEASNSAPTHDETDDSTGDQRGQNTGPPPSTGERAQDANAVLTVDAQLHDRSPNHGESSALPRRNRIRAYWQRLKTVLGKSRGR